jgi:dTDP-4-dehydrorhamnose reductase
MRILLTGASGQLGAYVLRELVRAGLHVAAWSGTRAGSLEGVRLTPVDLSDRGATEAAFRTAHASAVIHAAAVATVSECLRDPDRAQRVNVDGTAAIAELAAATGTRLVHVSSDVVFDGAKGWYTEEDDCHPLSAYGRTKAAAEQAARLAPASVIARISLLFGPTRVGRPAFFDQQQAALREGRRVVLFEDEWRTPLGLATAAQALVCLARSDITGLLHLGGPERMSRYEMGLRLAAYLHADPSPIVAASRSSAAAAEPRPRDTSLDSSRWRALFPHHPWPAFEQAIREMGAESMIGHQ